MIWTLYKIELYKMGKRLATWITVLCFAVLITFMFGSYYYNGLKYDNVYFGFPNAWPNILSDGAFLADIFSAVLITLLVASEFDWRTSRQNIMDGLSKGQWFTAKLLLLPTIAVLFYGLQVFFAGTLAWLGTNPEIENAYTMSSIQFLAIAGVIVGVLCYSSIALLVSLITRSAGPALGVTIIYQVFENLTTRTLRGFGLDTLADCFPFQVHLALFKYNQYLPDGSEARSKLDVLWDTNLLFAAGIGWIAVFVIASWLAYWKRDL